jgi:hypothetical protein
MESKIDITQFKNVVVFLGYGIGVPNFKSDDNLIYL